MCFMAGANAVFTGEQMLTTPCTSNFKLKGCLTFPDALLLGSPWDEDKAMMGRWGLDGMRSFEQVNVARKEGERLLDSAVSASTSSASPASEVASRPSAIPAP